MFLSGAFTLPSEAKTWFWLSPKEAFPAVQRSIRDPGDSDSEDARAAGAWGAASFREERWKRDKAVRRRFVQWGWGTADAKDDRARPP